MATKITVNNNGSLRAEGDFIIVDKSVTIVKENEFIYRGMILIYKARPTIAIYVISGIYRNKAGTIMFCIGTSYQPV